MSHLFFFFPKSPFFPSASASSFSHKVFSSFHYILFFFISFHSIISAFQNDEKEGGKDADKEDAEKEGGKDADKDDAEKEGGKDADKEYIAVDTEDELSDEEEPDTKYISNDSEELKEVEEEAKEMAHQQSQKQGYLIIMANKAKEEVVNVFESDLIVI